MTSEQVLRTSVHWKKIQIMALLWLAFILQMHCEECTLGSCAGLYVCHLQQTIRKQMVLH